jgi:RNA-binding protein
MFSKLQEVGTLLHIARSGRLIVRLSKKVEPGSLLADSKGRSQAKVVELIGPTSRPYASASTTTNGVDARKGDKLFLARGQ